MSTPANPSTSSAAPLSPGTVDSFGVINFTGPYKQLWHLLLGTTDVASNDVVHEELVQRCNTIISGLIYYDNPTPVELPTVTTTTSKKEKLKIELMKSLGITDAVALELMSLFFLYEYKGVVKSLEELLVKESIIKKFVEEVIQFYMKERLCVLYCAQVILAGAANNHHPFSAIFSGFIASASMPNWCKWLCLSLKKTKNDDEHVQVLHTLCLLLYNFGEFDGVMDQFSKGFTFGQRSTPIMYAEAIVLYAFLQSGSMVGDSSVESFLTKNAKVMDENPFTYGALLGVYLQRCPQNEVLRSVTRQAHHPEKCISNMCHLLAEYSPKGFRNKHGVTGVIFKCIYTVAEAILERFEKNTFGEDRDWNQLLLTLLGDTETAHLFMLEQPAELTLLYTEALMSLPVEVEWSLAFWAATCRTATKEVPACSILERITELNALAKIFEGDDAHILRPNGNGEWILLGDLNIGGVIIPAGSVGQTLRDQPEIFITWELDSPAKNVTIWDVLLDVVIRKAYEECPNFQKETIPQLTAIAKFLAEFSEVSIEAPQSLVNLFKPIIIILKRIVDDVQDSQLKSTYLALLLNVVKAGSVYSVEYLLNSGDPALWPTPVGTNYVAETILAYESVFNCDYSVTKTFLQNMIGLFEIEREGSPYYPANTLCLSPILSIDDGTIQYGTTLRHLYSNAITFIVENIYPSLVRWRLSRPSDQFEILKDTFKILCTLFKFKDPAFDVLKRKCCMSILVPGNSLLAVLATDSDDLEDAWVRSSKDNQFLDQTIYYALSLLVCMSDFEVKTLKMLDNCSNLTLVKKLGKLVRHRLNPTLPTLAIDLLRKMALQLNVSILACFGASIDSFRDLLQQRLEYKTEASKLKVAILEFLTVCAQTQPGLIQHFFQDETSITSLLELLSETESNVPVSALSLVRALIRKSNTIFKSQGNELWDPIMKPIKALDKFPSLVSKRNIISYTANILSFEIYRVAVIEREFATVLNELLEPTNLLELIKVGSTVGGEIEDTKKCIYALKHFLTLVLARSDHEVYLPESVRQLCLNEILNIFGIYLEMEKSEELLPGFAELMSVLGPSSDSGFLEKLCIGLPLSFKTVPLGVQVPLLTLVQRSIGMITTDISLVTIESLVRILADVFYHAAKIYDSTSIYLARPLLAVAASIMYGIITSKYCKGWANIFKRRMMLSSIVTVAHVGIQKGEGPEIVQDALGCLIRLSRFPETGDMLRNVSFTTELYLPFTQYSTPDTTDEKWFEVFMLCTDLNSAMMECGHFYFLEESLNFWTIHAEFVITKLFGLTQLINHSYLQTPDQNFHTIKQLLSFVVVAFYGISVMTSYFQKWRLQQRQTLVKLMEGVLTTLETSVSLLSQPNHLLLVITKATKGTTVASPAFKLTPQLLEVQTKLWEVVSMGVHLCLKIGPNENELICKEKILPLLFSIIGLCGRVLSKHSDKKTHHPLVNVTSEVSITLEKSLTLVLRYVLTSTPRLDEKMKEERQAFLRETNSEITSLCDMVRRLGLPPEDFSIKMSTILEESMKQM